MFENKDIQRNAGIETSSSSVDAGLRSYMLKVYNYMATGLLITAFSGYLLVHTGLISNLYSAGSDGSHSLNLLGIIVLLSPLGLVFGFGSAVSRMNIKMAQIIFFLFSALFGLSIANIFLMYTEASIVKVFIITAGTFAGMSLYGYTTKRDLTGIGSFLRMGLIGIIIASVVNLYFKSAPFDYILSFISVFVFVGLTAYDTQKIKAIYNSHSSASETEAKAIVGALTLYLDFINLFLALMRIFGERK